MHKPKIRVPAREKKNRDAGCAQYLELIGFLNDDLEFGVLPQDWAPHLRDPTLLLLLAGQWLLFLILLCKAKNPWVNQAQLVTLDLALCQRGRSGGLQMGVGVTEQWRRSSGSNRQGSFMKCYQEVCNSSNLRRSPAHLGVGE